MTASVAYKKAHKDVEAELCEDARKLLKDQKTFNEKYQNNYIRNFPFFFCAERYYNSYTFILTIGIQHHVHKRFMDYPYMKPLNVYSLRAMLKQPKRNEQNTKCRINDFGG